MNYDEQQHTVKLLAGFAGGMRGTVVYFQQTAPINIRTSEADGTISSVHGELLQINEFELVFQAGLAFDENVEENYNTVTGTAYVYPGIYPKVGDLFLYEINPGQLGLFKVNDSKKLSIRRFTYHAIEFILVRLPSSAEVETLTDAVTEIVYFSKQKFGAGENALLESETYLLIRDIHIIRNVLIEHYKQLFWDEHMYGSFVKENGVYDPYMVDFLNRTLSFMDVGIMPKKLLTVVPNRNDTLLYALLHPGDVPKEKLKKFVTTRTHTLDQRATVINTLLNRSYNVVISDEEAGTIDLVPLYILGQTFYNNDPDKYTLVDKLISAYMTEKVIYQNDLMTLSKQYRTLSSEEQFYRIPIYILLLDALAKAIT